MGISGAYVAFGPEGPVGQVFLEVTAGRSARLKEQSCSGITSEETMVIIAGRWGRQIVCVEGRRAWVSIRRSQNGISYQTSAVGHSPTVEQLTGKLVELTRFMASRVQLLGAA